MNDTLYCENCEIYFTVKGRSQLIKSLPVTETKQRFLNLCSSCTKAATKSHLIKCRSFREYYKRLPYCSSCRALNLVFLKNQFFKNFLLYKKVKRVFGAPSVIALLLVWNFFERYIGVLYYYISIKAGHMSVVEFIFTTVMLYHMNQYAFVRFALLLVCLYRLVTRRVTYFEMPLNPLSSQGLNDFIDRLSINGSFDSDFDRYGRKPKLPQTNSQPLLRNKSS